MITLIAAMDANNLIGAGNALPWHLPEDLAHFKETTLNRPIIMGRKTWESLPLRPLPKRHNIVITSGEIEGIDCFDSINTALEFAATLSDEVFVIGGASIYQQTIAYADRLLISMVDGTFAGDTYFPDIDLAKWTKVSHIGTRNGFNIMDYRKE